MADVLGQFGNAKGFTSEELANLKQYADSVAQVESLGQPDAVQGGGGPGRGKYQYELSSRGSGRNKTGRQRLKNFEAKYGAVELAEKDREILSGTDPDYSRLSEDAQDAIFYADLAMGPTKTKDLASGKTNPEDEWIKNWWAGSEDQADSKRDMWRRAQAYKQQLLAQQIRQ